jgi:hypothetical protein
VKLIEVGCDLVEFVGVEVAVDVRGDGRCVGLAVPRAAAPDSLFD